MRHTQYKPYFLFLHLMFTFETGWLNNHIIEYFCGEMQFLSLLQSSYTTDHEITDFISIQKLFNEESIFQWTSDSS